MSWLRREGQWVPAFIFFCFPARLCTGNAACTAAWQWPEANFEGLPLSLFTLSSETGSLSKPRGSLFWLDCLVSKLQGFSVLYLSHANTGVTDMGNSQLYMGTIHWTTRISTASSLLILIWAQLHKACFSLNSHITLFTCILTNSLHTKSFQLIFW